MNASPQVGFSSFNSLIRDFIVGFSFLILIICWIHISNEAPDESLKYNLVGEIYKRLSELNDDKPHEALSFVFIIGVFVLSILLGLLVDALGHIFTDNVCNPVHKEWNHYWDTIYYKELMVANNLISKYFSLPHLGYANSEINSVFASTKNKKVNVLRLKWLFYLRDHMRNHNSEINSVFVDTIKDKIVDELKLKWLFYSNAPNHTINARQELWLYYEFYRNIGLVIFFGLCLLVLTPINGFYLKMGMLFFGFLAFALIARTAKLVYKQISEIEVRFVINHLLDNRLMQDAYKDSK